MTSTEAELVCKVSQNEKRKTIFRAYSKYLQIMPSQQKSISEHFCAKPVFKVLALSSMKASAEEPRNEIRRIETNIVEFTRCMSLRNIFRHRNRGESSQSSRTGEFRNETLLPFGDKGYPSDQFDNITKRRPYHSGEAHDMFSHRLQSFKEHSGH